MPDDSLRGRTALVTGSTAGIGLGLARALAGAGCNVMFNGIVTDRAPIDAMRAELEREHRIKTAFSGADLRQPKQIEDLVRDTSRQLGPIDILVNNAGIQHVAAIHELPPDKWDAILAINLSASYHTIRQALPEMRKRKWGRIVNTASVHGLVASINKVAYVAAKHGLIGLTKVVALETAGSGVTCNAICPGFTRTELVETQIDARAQQLGVSREEGARHMLAEKQPSQQFVTVEQLGALLVFLCSDAAAQITGVSLPVDGGWTAQ
jgi:3-hydroxybutyrate dehydrogenase